MKIARLALFAVSLLLGAGHAVAAGPGHQGNFRLNPAQCQLGFNQSQAAAAGCESISGFGFKDGICSFGALCPRQDGSKQENRLSTRLENMPLLKNCNGRLGFICN